MRYYIHRFSVYAASVVALTVAVSSVAHGFALRQGDSVTIAANEVVDDDVYAFAETITVEGTITGDLIAMGREIRVAGTVQGDLIAAGQTVVVTGTVGDDARIAGQVLKVAADAAVEGDIVAAGFSLETDENGRVGGDLLYAGYQARLAGSCEQDAWVAAGALAVDGTIGGNLNAEIGSKQDSPAPAYFGPPPEEPIPSVSPGLTVGPEAEIGGNLTYRSAAQGRIDPGARILGETQHTPISVEPSEPATLVERVLGGVRRFAILLLVGLCLVGLMPNWTCRLATDVRTRLVGCFLRGLVGALAVPFIFLVVLVGTVLISIGLGLATLEDLIPAVVFVGVLTEVSLVGGTVIFVILVAQVLVGVAVGDMVLTLIAPGQVGRRLLPLLIGLVILVPFMCIPVAGLVIACLNAIFGLGALWLWWFSGIQAPHILAKGAP